MFGVTILGNNSAIPAHDRHPTAQALTWNDQVFLIDCGEGTQTQLARYRIKRGKINHIFISHLHGDHYFGLIGILTSLGLMGRDHPLHVYASPALKTIIDLQLLAAGTRLPFDLVFIPIEKPGLLLDDKSVTVHCFPTRHRIPCWGFRFTEKKLPRTLLKEKAIEAGIPQYFYNRLKAGEDYTTKTGEVIANELVTAPASPPLSYAFCADTLYEPAICEHLMDVSLLYHEATYLHELSERASSRFHSTAHEAGLIAREARAQRLIIGHFSSIYDDLEPLEKEAQQAFPASELALEGTTYLIPKH